MYQRTNQIPEHGTGKWANKQQEVKEFFSVGNDLYKAKKKQTKTHVIEKPTALSFRLELKFLNLFEGLRLIENTVKTFLFCFF